MSRMQVCLLSLMFNCVLGRLPGAYNGNMLYAKDPTPIAASNHIHARDLYNASSPQYINFTIYNNFDSTNMHMWVTGNDIATGDVVMLLPNCTWYFPNASYGSNGFQIGDFVAIPLPSIGNTLNLPLPGYLSSGRVWFADGLGLKFGAVIDGNNRTAVQQPTAGIVSTDPTFDVNFGYMELSYGPTSPPGNPNITTGTIAYIDISEVDFAGLPVGFSLYGCEHGVQQVPGLNAGAVSSMCSSIQSLPSDANPVPSAPWNETCIIDSDGTPIRVISPGDLGPSRYNSFWSAYVDEVWDYYASNTLQLLGDYATPLGNCTVIEDNLNCTGGLKLGEYNRTFSKPDANDIYSCATGPFASQPFDSYAVGVSVPILCAAFNRGTFLLPGGDIQPQQSPSVYYTNDINNYYSKFVHANAFGGLGYAFPYDDVTPADETNESGTIVDTAPLMLAITVGGPVLPFTSATPLSGVSCPTYPAAPAGAGGPSGPSGPKTFPYNPVVPAPTCTVPLSAAVVYNQTATPSQVAGYTYLGCWTDDNANRTLQYAQESFDMTLENCAGNATYNGYSIFGVEYTFQCYADNVVNTGAACPALSSDCNDACDGNSNQICGGPNRINLYQIIPATAIPKTTVASSTLVSNLSSSGYTETTSTLVSNTTNNRASTTSSATSSSITRITEASVTISSSVGSSTLSTPSTSSLSIPVSPSMPSTSASTTLSSIPASLSTPAIPSNTASVTSSSTSISTSTSASSPNTTAITTTSSTLTQAPLPTSTGAPECDTIFLNSAGLTYRIYCNATITGTNLDEQSPFPSFADCIMLCESPLYNSTCIGSVFTNDTDTTSCVLKSNTSSTAGSNVTIAGSPSRLRVKRDVAIVFQSQVFAAYRLLDPAGIQGPPDPPNPAAPSTSSTAWSSISTASNLLTQVSPSVPPTPAISPLYPASPSSSAPDLNSAHLFTPSPNTLSAVSPSLVPSLAIPILPGQRFCSSRKSVTVVAQVTVTTCPSEL